MKSVTQVASEVQEDGVSAVGALDQSSLLSVEDHLGRHQVYGAHVKRYSDGVARIVEETRANESAFACYDIDAAVRCPCLLETALVLVPAARTFFGAEPVLYSMNVWWSFQGHANTPGVLTRGWHTDGDDSKIFAVFFYLTDVLDSSDGAHVIRRRSGGDETVLGPAGTIFVTDPTLEHLGLPPEKRDRLAAWARFGVSEPAQIYYSDGLHVVRDPARAGMDPELRRVARFLLNTEEGEDNMKKDEPKDELATSATGDKPPADCAACGTKGAVVLMWHPGRGSGSELTPICKACGSVA